MRKGPANPSDSLSAAGCRVGLAVSQYNAAITESLRAGAVEEFARLGGSPSDLLVAPAPGAFELPIVARALVHSGDCDAVVALGCLIKGETPHDRIIADAVAHGLTHIALETGVPVLFGVLTVDSIEQARARSGGALGNKGAQTMTAAIETIHTLSLIARNAAPARS